MISPGQIPQYTGNLAQLELDHAALKKDAGKVRGTGSDVHSQFQGLSAYYDAPEAEQLFATTKTVRTRADTFADHLETVSCALSDYATEIRPLVTRLTQLKADATTFVNSVKDDDDWQYDGDKVDEHNQLRDDITTTVAAFWAAERTCHNKITATWHGTQMVAGDGSEREDQYGFNADDLKNAKLPWGDPVDEKHHWYEVGHWVKSFVWDGIVVDGIWGTLKGLGTLVGFGGWDAMGQAWKGLAQLATGLALSSIPGVATAFWALPDDKLPSWIRDSRTAMKETGKALVAWDEWGKNPARAAGAVTFNVVTTVFTGGSGAAASGAGKAGAIAKVLSAAGKAGKVIDPMTYITKGAGAGLSKIGDIAKGLKGIGNIDIPTLPDGAVHLPDGRLLDPNGNLFSPDGTIETTPIPHEATPTIPDHFTIPDQQPVYAGAHPGGDSAVHTADATDAAGRYDTPTSAPGHNPGFSGPAHPSYGHTAPTNTVTRDVGTGGGSHVPHDPQAPHGFDGPHDTPGGAPHPGGHDTPGGAPHPGGHDTPGTGGHTPDTPHTPDAPHGSDHGPGHGHDAPGGHTDDTAHGHDGTSHDGTGHDTTGHDGVTHDPAHPGDHMGSGDAAVDTAAHDAPDASTAAGHDAADATAHGGAGEPFDYKPHMSADDFDDLGTDAERHAVATAELEPGTNPWPSGSNRAGQAYGDAYWNDFLDNLDPEAEKALNKYSDFYYTQINGELRGPGPLSSPIADIVHNMDRVMGTRPVPEDIMVVRGTRIDHLDLDSPLDMEGRTFEDDGYTSTSLGKDPAFEHQPVVMHWRVPKGTPALWIDHISANPGERELLLARGTKYKVTRVFLDSAGKWHAYGEVLPRP